MTYETRHSRAGRSGVDGRGVGGAHRGVIPGHAVLNRHLAAKYIECGSRVGLVGHLNQAEIGLAQPKLEPAFAVIADGCLAGQQRGGILLIENGCGSIDDDRRVLNRQIISPGVAVRFDIADR